MTPHLPDPSPSDRRAPLLDAMAALNARGVHCGSCVGVCCTHVANSMKITRREAEDLKDFLSRENRWNDTLFLALRETVRRYRLDVVPGDGRRSLRKTYTCPFYTGSALGCSIAPESKPYGCLAFNPRSPGLTEGGDCGTDVERLERVQDPDAERHPIPVALLRLVPHPEAGRLS